MDWGSESTAVECKDVCPAEKPSMVDHPIYYNRKNAIECIDEMELIYGTEALMHFCLLSCHKYRYRAGLKNSGYEDIEKSDWYMRKYKELKEKIAKQKGDYLTIHSPDTKGITISPYNVQCSPTITSCN